MRALRFWRSASRRLRHHSAHLNLEQLDDRILLSGFALSSLPANAPPDYVAPVGEGSVSITAPAGASGPPVAPNVSADFTGVPTSNQWWSSLEFRTSQSQGAALYPHPLAVEAQSAGLGIGYPTSVNLIRNAAGVATQYEYPYRQDLAVTLNQLGSSDVQVAGNSDWAVTASWQNGPDRLLATIGKGLPFVYFTRTGSKDATITFAATPQVLSNTGGSVAVTVNGHHYGIFGPTGSTWSLNGTTLSSNLAGKDYLSIAVLPDDTPQTLSFYRSHAYAFVTDTKVTWQYDQSTSQVITTYTVTTVAKETGAGLVNQPLQALLPTQWNATSATLTPYTYISPRGQMKVFDGSAFTTRLTYHGVLPMLPTVGEDSDRLKQYLQTYASQAQLFPTTPPNTYDAGKRLQEVASLIPLAEQVGDLDVRDKLLNAVKQQLETWFDSGAGGGQFTYDSSWHTLIGYPAAYGSDTQLNDHHFHYGYFVMAAAVVAEYDPTWAQDSHWGGMVQTLIRDVANPDRADSTFPFMRNFDIYEGHSWASGSANFFAGNNEESSSEAINFATGLILFGAATGNTALRDQGIYLYTTETTATQQYWFDVNDTVFPAGFGRNAVGMVWGDGATYATWFSGKPEHIRGINYLPSSGGSLYLGQYPDNVAANYAQMVAEIGGPEREWQDRIWQYQAFADPAAALAKFNANPTYVVSAGESRPHTYAWLSSLNALGQVEIDVTADTSSYAVFNKSGVLTYAAWNPGSSPLVVHFSDGFTMAVAPKTMGTAGGVVSSWRPQTLPTAAPGTLHLSNVPALITAVRGASLTFTATAGDPDATQTLTFSLLNAPSGAAINPTTGVFTYTPDEYTLIGAVSFDVVVTDNGSGLSADQTVNVDVREIALVNGDLLVSGTSGSDVIVVRPLRTDATKIEVLRNRVSLGQFDLAAITGQIGVYGHSGNDRITIAAAITTNAELVGGAGNDTLTGGTGNDSLHGGAGNDVLVGRRGDDTYSFADAWGVDRVVEGVRRGRDRMDFLAATVDVTFALNGLVTARNGRNVARGVVEEITGGAGNDTFRFGAGKRLAGVIDGGGGINTLSYAAYRTRVRVNLLLGTATGTAGISHIANVAGGRANDILVGSAVANVLLGNGGRDLLIGGAGADSVNGGAGDDIVAGSATNIANLDAMMMAWARVLPYATRVANLASILSTVLDDGAGDWLTGGPGRDWFLTGLGDLISDKANGGTETQTQA